LQNNPSAQICYCSAEDFTNDLMKAVRLGAMAWFHKKYRQIDCLLLDDLQFLGEDIFTQEVFFHTFNSL
jgi:chromosomal replication initiator protein